MNLDHPTSRNLADLVGPMRARCERFALGMRAADHPIRWVETHRSQERQAWLYGSGRSRTGPVVTHVLFGAHNLLPGETRAADWFFDAPDPWSMSHPWLLGAALAGAAGLESGASWSSADYGHVQYLEGKRIEYWRERIAV